MRLFKVHSLNFKRPFITNVIVQDSSVSIVTGKEQGDRGIIFRFREMEKSLFSFQSGNRLAFYLTCTGVLPWS